MNEIKLLPDHLINQIKAGEVVESPSSLIKELVENSLDANSNNIQVRVNNLGLDSIEVIDNGTGITPDELPLAFGRHATSKIRSFSDIYSIFSFGFRGEALASISSVAKLRCTSVVDSDEKNTGVIEIEGGQLLHHSTFFEAKPTGTAIVIKDLFYNTPARLKFLKSQNNEKTKIQQIIGAFVLANPKVKFSLSFDQNEPIIYSPVSGEQVYQKRAYQFLQSRSRNFNPDHILKFEFDHQGHQFLGLISSQAQKGGNRFQYLFVNGRLFEDKKIHQIILIKMRERFWPQGTSGHYIIHLRVSPELIDPNVHPSKTQIKFVFPEIIISGISSQIKRLGQLKAPHPSEAPREENASPTFSKPVEERHFSPSILPNFTEKKEIQQLSSSFHLFQRHFFIYSIEGQSYLGDFKKVVIDYLSYLFHKTNIQTTPLLIGEEVSQREDISLKMAANNLKGFHFETEFIENQALLVKEIPSFLSKFGNADLLGQIISSLSTLPNKAKLRENLINITYPEVIFSEVILNEMIKELTLGHFIETKSMMVLDQQKISNWITTHDPQI